MPKVVQPVLRHWGAKSFAVDQRMSKHIGRPGSLARPQAVQMMMLDDARRDERLLKRLRRSWSHRRRCRAESGQARRPSEPD